MARKVRNTSAKGRRKEHAVRDIFTEKGYYVVRSAGSLGYFDLIALPVRGHSAPTQFICRPVLIQCKPKKYTAADRKKLEQARFEICGPAVIQAWVIPDRKKPYMEFQL